MTCSLEMQEQHKYCFLHLRLPVARDTWIWQNRQSGHWSKRGRSRKPELVGLQKKEHRLWQGWLMGTAEC